MSFILALAMLTFALLIVLVLAAAASFPRHVLTDNLAPEGEWSGPARLPHAKPVQSHPGTDRSGPMLARPLKIHSWI